MMGGSEAQMQMVENFIKTNDIKQPQADLEVSIVELNEQGSRECSNNWSVQSNAWGVRFAGGSVSGGREASPEPRWFDYTYKQFVDGKWNDDGTYTPPQWITVDGQKQNVYGNGSYISWTMNYLIENQKGRVLANPKLLITNGQESVIDLTQDYIEKVTSEFLSSSSNGIGATGTVQKTYTIGEDQGIKVSLTPFISPDGYVTLNIAPEYSTIAGQATTTGETGEREIAATLLSRRNLDLKNVRIKDGETLIIAGLLRFGTYIKYIPYPVVIGFTAGIGLLLITTQIKDLLGLQIENLPSAFLPKWRAYLSNLGTFSWSSVLIAVLSFGIIFYCKAKHPKLPAYLLSVVGSTIFVGIVSMFGVDAVTIGSQFGGIPHFLPAPQIPSFDLDLFLKVIPSGLTIAFLAGVESLLSATVVDGMSGDNHNSNAELIGEGIANIICSFFMGVPATGAIARTATNFKANAYSPIAGMMQSVFLVLFMLLLSPLAKYIPLSCLAAVLTLVGWNMLGIDKMLKVIEGPRGDRYTLIVTLALIIFMHRMSREMEIETEEEVLVDQGGGRDLTQVMSKGGVMSLRLSGPLFFGAASQVSESLKNLSEAPKVLILRMGYVPLVDATGAHIIVDFVKKAQASDMKIIFSNVKKQPRRVLKEAFQHEEISSHNISTASTFENAVKMARRYLRENIKAKALADNNSQKAVD